MTDRSTAGRAPKVRSVPGRDRAGADPAGGDARIAAEYADRGLECVFANVRLLGRVVTSYYDEALKPVDLRASQLALMWAVLASEPVEMGRLGNVTQTDQTTLSRTVDKLRQAGLVGIEAGTDRRVRLLRLTAKGRRQFARAIPLWDEAQRGIDRWLSVASVRALARQARRMARAGAAGAPMKNP